jgi:dATP pyrophosphohydrolase
MHGGGFIFVLCPKTLRILLGKRNTDTEWHPGEWFTFGGTMEDGETPKETAIREFFEETKLTSDKYKISDDYIYKAHDIDDKNNIHHIHIFLATMNGELFPEIDIETQDWKWFPIRDIPKIKAHPILFEIFSDINAISHIKKALLQN